jgi:hypothetical protein
MSELVYEFDWELEAGGKGGLECFDVMKVEYIPIGERDMNHLMNMHWCEPGEYKHCTQWQVSLHREGTILVIPMAPDKSSPYDHPFCEIDSTEFSAMVSKLQDDEFHIDA